MAETMKPTATAGSASSTNRWAQLIIGIVCMVLIANMQYGWTLFVNPMAQKHGWTIAGIQVAFSIFIALETWFTPIHGWIADRLGPHKGPRLVVSLGGLLVAVGWIINSYAETLGALYLGAVISGIGGGAVYAVCVGNAVKWFADHRGLAVGLTAAGYGAGAALTVIPMRMVIGSSGYETAFFWFGLIQGGVVFLIGWLLRGPLPGEAPVAVSSAKVMQSARSFSPSEMLRTPTFWLLYLMFVLIAASGLMATAQIAVIAKNFGISNEVLVFGATTLTVALIVDNVLNGAARPFFGWVSDRIGREYTMAIAFGAGGIAYWLLGTLGHSPWAFVVFAGLIFFTWGEIFSLFPSTCTDTFGPKFATVNTAFLYTAKGTSAFLVPLANVLKEATGGWHAVFVVTAIANFAVVILALFVLRPLRHAYVSRSQGAADPRLKWAVPEDTQ
ncbi:MAG TPA: oxalate/formate MFS antiporter [Casimicrobiaceae bacterium]|nr:oxalate/formate MFS antiporter [Casimicrobiaceae bacterium]